MRATHGGETPDDPEPRADERAAARRRAVASHPVAPSHRHGTVRVYTPPAIGPTVVFGAMGGPAAGAVFVLVLGAAAAFTMSRPAVVAPNAVGALAVRWLQTSAPQALDNFYWDATAGGVAIAMIAGAAVGAVFAGALERLPEDHPLAWGGVFGLAAWAALRWAIGPALDPVLTRTFGAWPLLAACLCAGLVIGGWTWAGWVVRAAGDGAAG